MVRKRNKARKRLTAQRKPTEQQGPAGIDQHPYAAADAMWHALMNALVRDGRR